MSEIKVLFDASIITGVRNDIKSGIFFVARAMLLEFLKRDDINITIFSAEIDIKLAEKNLERYIGNSKLSIVHKYTPNTTNSIKRKLKEVARKAVFLAPEPIALKLFSFARNLKSIMQKQREVKTENLPLQKPKYDAFFSPIFLVNDEYLNLTKFIVIYDAIPLIYDEYKKNPANAWFLELARKLDESYTCFAISSYTKTDFLKYLPHLKPENIIVTPLACDERFKPANADEIARARKKYNIPENKKYIFSLCTLEPRKNLIRAVKCFANFISKNNIDDLVFVLGGAHWDAFIEKLENEIGSLDENIKSKILKIGYVDDSDQAALYSGALFFVYTSQYEGFGLPPLEAMSCGTPVITSNNSSLPEVVGNAGIMIDYDDDEAHIKAYESYYYNENLRQENSKKGLERAKLFSWKKCADIMITEMKRRAGL